MDLKYIILLLTTVCVIFIVVQEIFLSSSWSNPRSRLIASKSYHKSVDIDDINVSVSGGEEQFPHQRQKGGWIEDDDVDHQSTDDDVEGGDLSMKKWKDGRPEVREQSTDMTKKPKKGRRKFKNWRNRQQLWDDSEHENLDEEEKLRISPFIYHEEEETKRLSAPVIETEVKYLSHFLPYELAENRRLFRSCRYKKCQYVNDMTKAHMVAFKAGNIRDHDILTFDRPPGQRWLMYTIDPAIRGYTLGRDNIKSLFNDTMTYNLDSDVPQIFGRLRKVPLPTDIDFDALYDGKSKTAAWFVSHCVTPSKREDYVKKMQTVVNVDVYGECGTLSCGTGKHSRGDDKTICLPLLSSTYKFYLAFENAFCIDYVTEKFFKLFQDVQVVPVVRGGFQYKKYLPSGAFVDANDFETAEKLSRYLIQLGNDKERYLAMLKKKNEWELVLPESRHCLLCGYLHSNPQEKFYPNLQQKFGRKSCWYPKIQ